MEKDIAQICINGHIINELYLSSPEDNRDYCNGCGAETITKCTKCHKPIKGNYITDMPMFRIENFSLPKYCEYCGSPFPWTITMISLIKDLIYLTDNLTQDQKSDFLSAIEELIKGTPKCIIANVKFRKYIKIVDAETAVNVNEILKEILVEPVRDLVFKKSS